MLHPRQFPACIALALVAIAAPLASAQQTWQLNSRCYQITTDLPRGEIEVVADHMDAVFGAYTDMFSSFHVRNAQPVKLHILTTRDAYIEHMASKGVNAQNTGGVFFYSQNEAGLATWAYDREPARMWHVLQHEGFHQFAHLRIGGNFPIWANEGLAEYFGKSLLIRGRLQTGLVPSSRLARIKRAINEHRTLPFDTFIRMDDREWSRRVTGGDARTAMMYDQAWSIAHFLIHADNGRYAEAFERFIRGTSRGLQLEQALQDAFQTTNLQAFEDAWKRWTLELEPDPISTATERLEFLGHGIQFLADNDVHVTSIDQLKAELRARSFKLKRFESGFEIEFDSADDDLFQSPAPPDARRQPELTLTPARGNTLPTVSITGLGVDAHLTWVRRDEQNAFQPEVVYR